jgi:hypothetical protein
VIKRLIWSQVERMMRNGQLFGRMYQELRYRGREDVVIIEHDN